MPKIHTAGKSLHQPSNLGILESDRTAFTGKIEVATSVPEADERVMWVTLDVKCSSVIHLNSIQFHTLVLSNTSFSVITLTPGIQRTNFLHLFLKQLLAKSNWVLCLCLNSKLKLVEKLHFFKENGTEKEAALTTPTCKGQKQPSC